MSKLRAVLFDVDGTLVDSNAQHSAAWSAACAEVGFDRPTSFFLPLIGMGGDRVLPLVDAGLNEDYDPGKSMLRRSDAIFAERFLPGLLATPGAKALVEHVRDVGLLCVVATSAKDDALDALLDVAGVRDLMHVTTTSDDAEASKPEPDIVLSALSKAGVDASEAVFVGDTPHDIAAAKKAGVPTIALRSGGWTDADLHDAIAIYDHPADLLASFATSPLATRA